MSNLPTDRVRGELLREWRVAQRCDVTALSSSANLSIAQILQLESGGTSLFYTPAIKENAARKVASLLGGDPASVIRPIDDMPHVSGPSVVDELVALSRQKGQAVQARSIFSRPPRWLLGSSLTAGFFVASLALFQHQGPSGGVGSLWQASTPHWAPDSQTDTVPMVTAPAPLAALVSAPRPLVIPAVAPEPVEVQKASSVHGLCQKNHPSAVLTPVSPSKAGDMVHIVAQKTGVICVVDGAGGSTVLSLHSNEARSVYGTAPWRVHFEQPEQAQLYFQGVRLRLPDASVTTVALEEGVKNR